MFWGMANHLGRFLGASGPSESREQVITGFVQPKLGHMSYGRRYPPEETLNPDECIIYFTPWRCPRTLTPHPPCSWPSDGSGAAESDPKWFPLPLIIGFITKIKFLRTKVQFHSLKLSLASYRPFTLYLTLRSMWWDSHSHSDILEYPDSLI